MKFFSAALFLAFHIFLFCNFTSCQKDLMNRDEVAIIGLDSEPRSLDPRYIVDANSLYVADFIHCSLIGFDKKGNLQKELATNWQWKTPLNLEIQLSDKFHFWDNRSVTANDVKATFDSILKYDADPSPKRDALSKVKEVKVLAPYKLEIILTTPDAPLLSNLFIKILPKEKAELGRINSADEMMGCGPFNIKNMNEQEVVLERIAKSPTLINYLKFLVVKDEGTRFFKLQKGEIDILQNGINRDQMQQIAKIPSLKKSVSPALNTTYLAFQFKDPHLKDLQLRRAISMAIDRKKIIEHLFYGEADLANTLLSPQNPFWDQDIPQVSFNIESAKSFFAKYLATNKTPIPKLKLRTTSNTTNLMVANSIAEDLKKIGLDVEVQSLEWGKFKQDVESGVAQMWILSWIGAKDPDIYRYAFATESAPPSGGNRGFYSSKELDALLTKGRETVDEKERKKIYTKVQKLIYDNPPYVNLWYPKNILVYNRRILGLEAYSDGRYISLMNATIASEEP